MITATVTVNDADIEAGMAQALAAYNASNPSTQIADLPSFVQYLVTGMVQSYKGAVVRQLAATVAGMDIQTALSVAAAINAAAGGQ